MPAPRSTRVQSSLLTIMLLVGAIVLVFGASTSPERTAGSHNGGTAHAQSQGAPAAVEGWLQDAASGAPVPGATVSLQGGPQTQSDENGYFAFGLADLSGLDRRGAAGDTSELTLIVLADGY